MKRVAIAPGEGFPDEAKAIIMGGAFCSAEQYLFFVKSQILAEVPVK